LFITAFGNPIPKLLSLSCASVSDDEHECNDDLVNNRDPDFGEDGGQLNALFCPLSCVIATVSLPVKGDIGSAADSVTFPSLEEVEEGDDEIVALS